MKINVKSLNIATITVIALITLLTIVSELSSGFKGSLTSLTGHHWVTKGVFSLILFTVVYFIFARSKDSKEYKKLANLTISATVIGGLIIFGFFVWHFMAG